MDLNGLFLLYPLFRNKPWQNYHHLRWCSKLPTDHHQKWWEDIHCPSVELQWKGEFLWSLYSMDCGSACLKLRCPHRPNELFNVYSEMSLLYTVHWIPLREYLQETKVLHVSSCFYIKYTYIGVPVRFPSKQWAVNFCCNQSPCHGREQPAMELGSWGYK